MNSSAIFLLFFEAHSWGFAASTVVITENVATTTASCIRWWVNVEGLRARFAVRHLSPNQSRNHSDQNVMNSSQPQCALMSQAHVPSAWIKHIIYSLIVNISSFYGFLNSHFVKHDAESNVNRHSRAHWEYLFIAFRSTAGAAAEREFKWKWASKLKCIFAHLDWLKPELNESSMILLDSCS